MDFAVPVTEVSYEIDGWGTGLLWYADGLLVYHELPRTRPAGPGPNRHPRPGAGRSRRPRLERTENGRTRLGPDSDESVTIAPQLIERLRRYFAGEAVSFEDVDIDLDWCTPFQRSVADVLRALPYGEIVSYGELAALAGHPNAQRAAGSFCAHNRVALVIPCHRVVAATGIGSYGSLGVGFKRRLLALEGVAL
jgi:methylated-DNA-[protein]-cysteine S-methyltransferase